jgi:selenocysteine lyase/cysteine desulfurase
METFNAMQENPAVMTREPSWEAIQNLFEFDRDYIQLAAAQFIVSHPKPLTEAIEYYRNKINQQPVLYTQENEDSKMERVRQACAECLDIANPNNIALTESTSMGLGTIYSGLDLQPGDEILTTDHDHYIHHESIRYACMRSGATFKKISLYDDSAHVTADEIVEPFINNITPHTRIVGITWVHSGTGVKLPVRRISNVIAKLNETRNDNKILMILDAVHGFGVELETFPELGCQFFITGCHKWLYGPRGTGFIAGTSQAWQHVTPIIPGFTDAMDTLVEGDGKPRKMDGKQMTPGGFHAFEHKWALYDAFTLMKSFGKEHVHNRIHHLARICKEELAAMPHIILHTPMDDNLSAGIVSFEIKDYNTKEAVEELNRRRLVVTASPYKKSYIRITPGIYNTEAEIEKALTIIDTLHR